MAVNVGTIEARLELEDKMSAKIDGATKKMGGLGQGVKSAVSTMAGFVGGQAIIAGLGNVFRGASESVFGMNATLETTTLQFQTLMGSTERAEAHVASLFEFAKRTPFETGPIIEASRMMQTFGGDVLNTEANLNLLGDASAATGAPINELGFWVGRLHSQLQSGKPFGEAAMRLQELAVLSPKARDEMERLQRQGATASEVYSAFADDLAKFSGGMERQAATWEGVTSTFADTIQLTIAESLKPLFEFAREGIGALNNVLNDPALESIPAKIAESLNAAFGDDIQGSVKKLLATIVGFIEGSLSGVDILVRVWDGFQSVIQAVTATVLLIGRALIFLARGVVGLARVVPGLNGALRETDDWLTSAEDSMSGWQESLSDASVENAKAAVGQTKFSDALKKGKSFLAGMRDTIAKSGDATEDLATSTGEASDAVTALGGATRVLTEDQSKIVKTWTEGAIPAAEDLIIALDEMGGSAALTDEEMGAANKTLQTAIDKYQALGQAVPTDLTQAFLSTITGPEMQAAVGVFGKVIEPPKLSDLKGWFEVGGQVYQEIDDGFMDKFGPKGTIVAQALTPLPAFPQEMYTFGKFIGSKIKSGFGEIIKGVPDTLISAFQGGGGLMGAVKSLGTQLGSMAGGSLGSAWGDALKMKEGEEGGPGAMLSAIAGWAGPIGAAIGALAGPLMGFLGRLFGGPSVQELVTETAARWGVSLSEGLADAIAETRETVSSDIGAMMLHLADIMREGGGVAGMGFSVAAGKVRDLFVMLDTGRLTVEQVGPVFDETFGMLADAAVEAGGIVGEEFLELIRLADEFGVKSGEVMAFVGEQTEIAATGLKAMATAGVASKEEMEDLGLITVAAFEASLAAGNSYTEAVLQTAPAIEALIAAQENLGITSDNVALNALMAFQDRIRENATLVTAVEGLDDTMLALSRTGALNAETLAAMERQGLRMFDKLIDAGFTENEALLMMADSVHLMMEAHEKLGIPIDENTQKLIKQMQEAGALEGKQKTGWEAVEGAINRVVEKLDEMINRILGVSGAMNEIPREVETTIRVNQERGDWESGGEGVPDDFAQGFQHGGVGDFGSGTPAILHGKEAIIPLDEFSGGGAMLQEMQALREELELLPIHLRDALLMSR